MQWAKLKQSGFTIVELLIVVVVIAILAAITIVAYNGIQDRAKNSAMQSDVTSFAKKIESVKAQSTTETYPDTLAAAGITATGVNYFYSALDNSFCVSKGSGTLQYSASSSRLTATAGDCGTGDMAGWYKMNGNGTDSGSSNTTATLTSVTPAVGQDTISGSAFDFNGTTSQLYIPSNFGISTSNVTLSTWVYSSATTNKGVFLKVGNASGAVASTNGIAIGMGTGAGFSSAGTFVGALYENSRWIMSTTALTPNVWHHFALVVNANGMPSLFLDGDRILTISTGTPPNSPMVGGTVIGGYSTDRFFTGRLDDARVINRALSAAEIKGMYASGAD